MADIFLSYKSDERDRVEHIARALEAEGFTVWWDYSLLGGQDYSDRIEREIAATTIVMPIWSRQSVTSNWVRAEAGRGSTKLFPIRIDDVDPPLPYNQLHTLDLLNWFGDRSNPSWKRIVDDLQRVISGEVLPRSVPTASVRPGPRTRWIAGLVVLALAAGGGAVALSLQSFGKAGDQPVVNATSAAGADQAIAAPQPAGAEANTTSASISPATVPDTSRPAANAASPQPAKSPTEPQAMGAPSSAPNAGQPDAVISTSPAPIDTYAEAMSALQTFGAKADIVLCRVGPPQECGLTSVRVGDVIKVRVTSPIAGRLYLIDRNARGSQMQIFPNGVTPAGAALSVKAGESLDLPGPKHGFEFAIGEPLGASALTVIILPEDTAEPSIVQENRRTRDILVIPRDRANDWAVPVANALARGGQGVAFGERLYEIVR